MPSSPAPAPRRARRRWLVLPFAVVATAFLALCAAWFMLRQRVAAGLDGAQAAALASLPFADKLEVIARSPAWPAGLVVTVDARMSTDAWRPIESALLGLAADRSSSSAAALAAIQLDKLVAIDDKVLASARQAYVRTP